MIDGYRMFNLGGRGVIIFHCLIKLGDYDRAGRVLFVQHTSEHGEWYSQNRSVAYLNKFIRRNCTKWGA